MQTKLTLSIDPSIVTPIKEYSLEKKISLSSLVESYFRILLSSRKVQSHVSKTPITDSLCGSLKKSGPLDADKARYEYLMEKYA